MTKFNPENKDVLTFGECLKPAMVIQTKEDADQYLADYIKYLTKFESKMTVGNTPEQVAKINIGYFAGYYDTETNQRVQRLFSCSHPIFGQAEPTAEEAFACGITGMSLQALRAIKKVK